MHNTVASVQNEQNLNDVIKIDAAQIKAHLGSIVRESVEETLNKLLDEEADQLCNAQRYEHTDERTDTRAGHYNRKLQTGSGVVNIKMPKLRKTTFETAIIERYRRREASVEESLIEMYIAGVSVRRVEDITEALWGTRVSSGTVSELNQKIYSRIELWRNRPITYKYPYVYLDGLYLKRSWGGEVRNVAILVAVGVDELGFRDIVGICEGSKEDKAGWLNFLRHLKQRGLGGIKLVISDKCLGLVDAIHDVYPDADWQWCMVHFMRDVFTAVPRSKGKEAAAMLKAIYAQENRQAAQAKADAVAAKLDEMRLSKAADIVRNGVGDTLTFYAYPSEHWIRIRTNNMLERMNREIRRRTRVVGNFPDGDSALMLVGARLRHIGGTKWSTARYLNMAHLAQMAKEKEAAVVANVG